MIVLHEVERPLRRWSDEDFRRLAQLGLISAPDAQLVDGEIFERGRPRRWTAPELYQLLDRAFFADARVELIEGEILEMGAQKNLHAVGITLSEDALRLAFGPGHWVRVQMSLDLTPHSVPDPDLAVVKGTPRTLPLHQNPVSALLLVEVSDTTLRYDRETKGSLYARAGIADYWILNLVDRRLEIYRTPITDSSRLYGMAYADMALFGPGDTVSPLACPHALIAVSDLLP